MSIQINGLDHVAIRVVDLEVSAGWYQTVLGLKRYDPPAWNGVPIFLLAGKTGIALFPATTAHPSIHQKSQNIAIDHFAFSVDRQNFDKAKQHYESLGLKFSLEDHTYFHSLYTEDPDGHTVELTTLAVEEDTFY